MEKLHPKSFICRRIYIGKTQNYQELTLGHIKMITWVSTLLHSHRSTTIREGQTQWWDSYTSVYDFWYPQNFFWNIASWKICTIHCLNLWILASAFALASHFGKGLNICSICTFKNQTIIKGMVKELCRYFAH